MPEIKLSESYITSREVAPGHKLGGITLENLLELKSATLKFLQFESEVRNGLKIMLLLSRNFSSDQRFCSIKLGNGPKILLFDRLRC